MKKSVLLMGIVVTWCKPVGLPLSSAPAPTAVSSTSAPAGENTVAVPSPVPAVQANSVQEHVASPASASGSAVVPAVASSSTTPAVSVHQVEGIDLQPDKDTKGDYSPDEVLKDFTEDGSLNTVDHKTGGNWLLKRIWWEKIEGVYEEIKKIFNKLMQIRTAFISDRNKYDRESDIFHSEVGIEQGQLQDVVSHAKDLMDKEKKVEIVLTPQERAFVDKLTGKSREIEQLKLDIKSLQELEAKIDDALDIMFKQIDVCNQYEDKAWENFKEVARELDDKEARRLYYNTEGLLKDAQNIEHYLETDFTTYFQHTLQTARDHMQKISAQMNTLKSDGVNLVKELDALKNPSVQVQVDKKQDQKGNAKKQSKEEHSDKGWYVSWIDAFVEFFSNIKAFFWGS